MGGRNTRLPGLLRIRVHVLSRDPSMNSFSMIHLISMEMIIKNQITRRNTQSVPSMLQSTAGRLYIINVPPIMSGGFWWESSANTPGRRKLQILKEFIIPAYFFIRLSIVGVGPRESKYDQQL